LISLTPPPIISGPAESDLSPAGLDLEPSFKALEATRRQRWVIFVLSIFLVSVPVFVQAPLVRLFPWYSLALTPALFWSGKQLFDRPQTQLWGDLVIGFTWTWFSGSIYWGWLRWEPLVHLPVEAIGLPFALWGISRGWGKVGNFFYIGSLSGTVVTDVYFYLTDLIPHWRSLMRVETEDLVRSIFQNAIAQIGTPQGLCWAGILTLLLLVGGLFPLRSPKLHWWAFGGAVISTLLVDGLFWLAAITA
jgi:hypothetical protein